MGTLLQCFYASLALMAGCRADFVGPPDYRSKNWGIYNTEAQSHVDGIEAQRIAEGQVVIRVAVVDTGVDTEHFYLKNHFVAGWDEITNKPLKYDLHGHGTHVSGIIEMVAGSHVEIEPIRYYSDAATGSVNLKRTVGALNWAVDHGARIINYSGGGPEFSEDEYLAIKRAQDRGVLVVAAAGNEHQNVDVQENFYYPGSYRLANVIVIAATDIRNNLLATSNWGLKRVDVAAPGENIFSTLPNGRFGYMSGTSQATAFVSGIAALVWSQNPKLTVEQVRNIIEAAVSTFPQLTGKIKTGGRVDALLAVEAARKTK